MKTPILPFQQIEIIEYSLLMSQSYRNFTGKVLIEGHDLASDLYYAPFPLVSHGNQRDPILRYGNLKAQQLWGMSWDELVRMPSRLTAEPEVAQERQRLLDEASNKGYVDNYRGIRISKDGRRFNVDKTILWNVVDSEGTKYGQAAKIGQWDWL